jgi:phage/plasmid-associated DNA primase
MSEVEDGDSLNDAQVRRLTGDDDISTRHLNQGERVWRAGFKGFLLCNYLPKCKVDPAMRRRILCLNMLAKFCKDKDRNGAWFERPCDESVKIEMPKNERDKSAFFNWLLQGWLRSFTDKLQLPDFVQHSTDEFFHRVDIVEQFKRDALVEKPGHKLTGEPLYKAYYRWETGEDKQQFSFKRTEVSERDFGQRLKDKIPYQRPYYIGYAIRPEYLDASARIQQLTKQTVDGKTQTQRPP